MMDENHFQKEMTRLSERFGTACYKKEFLRLLWKDVSTFSNEWFTQTISDFIYCSRQAPLGDEFKEKTYRQRELYKPKEIPFKEFDGKYLTCNYCHDVGTLLHEGYAYRCFCQLGARRTEKFPVFKPTG
jgi:hypothetical protein